MSGDEVANLAVPTSEDPFGEWLVGEVCKRVDMNSDTRLQLVTTVGERFWPKTLPQYREAGYPLNEVPFGISLKHYSEVGYTLRQAMKELPAGISMKDAMGRACMAGYPATEVEEVFDLSRSYTHVTKFHEAGYTVKEIRETRCCNCGVGGAAHVLARSGCSGEEIAANFPIEELRHCGISAKECLAAGHSPRELAGHHRCNKGSRYSARELLEAGLSRDQLLEADCLPEEGYPLARASAVQMRAAGFSAKDIYKYKTPFNTKQLKLFEAGYPQEEVLRAGFSTPHLQFLGVKAKELLAAGVKARALAFYSEEVLNEEGCNVEELRKAGYKPWDACDTFEQ